jgi:uncharacterized protein YodC (DUF2158 family)
MNFITTLNVDELHYLFSANEIINFGTFNNGDSVMLNSGGPKMIITKFCLELDGNNTRLKCLKACCQWYIENELQIMYFPVQCLKKYEE